MELHPARDPNCRPCASLMGLPCFGHFILWRAAEQRGEDVVCEQEIERLEVLDLERMWALPTRDAGC